MGKYDVRAGRRDAAVVEIVKLAQNTNRAGGTSGSKK